MGIFLDLLDKAGLNTYTSILFKQATGMKMKRRDFLIHLAEEFVQENNNMASSVSPIV